MTFPYRLVRSLYLLLARLKNGLEFRLRRSQTPSQIRRYDRLHLGSGARLLDGWANLDINGLGNLVWDLREPLPIKAGQVGLVYTEHFIEHITRADAKMLLTHARAVLKDDGVVRISTPDLAQMVRDYASGNLVQMPHGNWFPETLCQMMNDGMRRWGHIFVYDEPELTNLLHECGYSRVQRVRWGESEHPDLRNLESRPDFADLILEARP